ncbi:OmpH family outer membrane protein [Candidatus Margulisiibacteriota bacterium]
MKKFMVLVLVTAFFMGIAGSAFAAGAGMGYIDVQKVFKEYKATEKAQEEVSKQEESFKKEFESSQKKLAEAEKKDMKRSELDKLRKELEEKLEPKRERLVELNRRLTQKIQQEILDATKEVAKKVGIDMVFDKQVVITGGTDLTEMVVNKLNNRK